MDRDKKVYCQGLRDELGRERTILANERTFLAYIRTAIMLLASGMTLVELLTVGNELRVIGFVLIILSMTVGTFGYIRYARMRRQLKMVIVEEE